MTRFPPCARLPKARALGLAPGGGLPSTTRFDLLPLRQKSGGGGEAQKERRPEGPATRLRGGRRGQKGRPPRARRSAAERSPEGTWRAGGAPGARAAVKGSASVQPSTRLPWAAGCRRAAQRGRSRGRARGRRRRTSPALRQGGAPRRGGGGRWRGGLTGERAPAKRGRGRRLAAEATGEACSLIGRRVSPFPAPACVDGHTPSR